MNEHGLDYKYFEKNLLLLARDARNYKPDEMSRALARLAKTADEGVLREPEFERKECCDGECPLCA